MELSNDTPAPTNIRRRIVHPRIVRPLPCPHCGAAAELKRYQHDAARVYYGCSMPRCSYSYAAEADALAAWNRRELSWELEHSARYILEDANPEKLSEACGLPLGVVTAALKKILPTRQPIEHAESPVDEILDSVDSLRAMNLKLQIELTKALESGRNHRE